MTVPRFWVVPPDKDGIYSISSRCVRRGFLLGKDPYTGINYDHRKEWVRSRLTFLSSCFGVEVCAYAVMINHVHLILNIKNNGTYAWSSEEIARRWLLLFPKGRDSEGQPLEPSDEQIEAICSNPGLVETYRSRLNSVSWFMKSLNEWISRKANREDKCTGKFWEGRFKCTALKSQGAVLACMQYIDLNPIRAGSAQTPETSDYTSAQDRIRAMQARETLKRYRQEKEQTTQVPNETNEQKELIRELTRLSQRDSWLSSIYNRVLDEGKNDSFLKMKLQDYLTLLDWTGRNIVEGKKGSIPRNLAPLLDRMELNTENWLDTVQHFGRRFYHIAGPVKALVSSATGLGLKWMKGKTGARAAFT